MKKILFLLLFTITSYGQAVFDEGIQITNTESTTATKVNVQETDGTINTISKSDLVNVVEVNDVPSLPLVGEVGKIYVVKNLNKIYRWNGTFYQELAVTDISGKENSANKQNSLAVDGTGTKYPTVDAVNTGLGLKVDYNLPAIVANSTSGFINKNSQPFIHNFYAGVNPLQGGTGNNLNVGVNSGNFNSDNFNYASTMVGFESGMSNKNGYSNVGIGYRNLHLNQNGFGNSALGTYVLGNLTSGTQNTAIGWHSMLYSTTASENTAIGVEALWNNLVGLRNTALGMRAGASNIGNDNVFIGYNAGGAYTGSNSLYITNKDRTLIGGDFLFGTLYFNSNQNDFLTGSNSKIRISGSGSESKISFLDHSNSFQNAFFDAFDYRFRMSGVDKIVFSASGVITAASYTGSATLTGTPTAPTAPAGTNTTQIATTAFVQGVASSGTYTPTASVITGATGVIVDSHTYTKIGNIVTVYGESKPSSVVAGVGVIYEISLPIARTNTVTKAIGFGGINVPGASINQHVRLETSSTTTVRIAFNVNAAGTPTLSYSFQYDITK